VVVKTRHCARRLAAGFLLCGAVALGGLQSSSVLATASAEEYVPTTAISTGDMHTCALAADGTVSCWGANPYGQLGIGNNTDAHLPVPVSGGALVGKTVTQVSAGASHTCALLSEGTVVCWGYNGSGGLGIGNNSDTNLPVAVSGGALAGKTVVQISAGSFHTCALISDGTVACWGYNLTGQLGVGDNVNSDVPVAITGGALAGKTVAQISAGYFHTCALVSDGTVACWGYNNFGQLGDGGSTESNVPRSVVPGDISSKTIAHLATGDHTCALVSDGTVACWGYNEYGELGIGSNTISENSPQVIDGGALAGATVIRIAAGLYHTCAVVAGGTVSCWGDNDYGQLGVGDIARRNIPVEVVRRVRADATTIPTVSGTAKSGQTLRASDGTWIGTPTPTLSHQWYKCTKKVPAATRTIPTTCSAISGATGRTLVVSSALAGKYVAAGVTGESAGTRSVTWLSASTTSRVVTRPTSVTKPSVSGNARVDKLLTAAKGVWFAWPAASFGYQWYACSTKVSIAARTIPSTCRAIAGATASRLRLTAAQSGKYIAVQVTGTSRGNSATRWLSRSTARKVR